MSRSLSFKWFVSLSAMVGVFCLLQILGMIWLEVTELLRGEGTLREELSEIIVLSCVSACVFVLLSGGFWFFSKRMIKPLHAIAESAARISAGDLRERITDSSSSTEVTQLVSALNCAFDRYHETVDRLDKFAGNAAHQLRTPLASLRSAGEVCLMSERSVAEYRECIQEMLDVSKELAATVEKLLMIARLNPLRIRRQFCDVQMPALVREMLGLYEAAIDEKEISIEFGDMSECCVRGDRTLMRQVVGNVVENAVKFTPVGGSIAVSLHHTEKHVALRIADNGPGMPEVVWRRSGSNATNPWQGDLSSGRLGLVIAFEIMRIHEGRVDIRPREGGGTEVELCWPESSV